MIKPFTRIPVESGRDLNAIKTKKCRINFRGDNKWNKGSDESLLQKFKLAISNEFGDKYTEEPYFSIFKQHDGSIYPGEQKYEFNLRDMPGIMYCDSFNAGGYSGGTLYNQDNKAIFQYLDSGFCTSILTIFT
tara:strand:+ start:400 stop:798 length:399 start_codon:yes stop_codon:yes gene_type:complete